MTLFACMIVYLNVQCAETGKYSGGKNKRHKPDFPYKIGILKRLFRDKNV